MGGFLTGLIYILSAFLDTFLYGLAAILFNIIMKIAYIEILEDDFISGLASRIYLIVGVLILFRVAISAIQYLINPDAFSDKEKGAAGLLKNLLITVALIAIVPSVFKFALSIQKPVLQSIPAIILGNEASDYGIKTNGVNTTLDANAGEKISFMILSNFIRARSSKGGSVCDGNCKIHDITSFNSEISDNLFKGNVLNSILSGFNMDDFPYEYVVVFSTVAGGFLCYILLSMSLDIGIRAFKLAIIQMLAPIPISSYAFDKEKFKKFAKTSLQVYADLFIRMVIVFLIIFLIQRILRNVNVNVGSNVKINTGGSGILGWLGWFEDFLVRIVLIFGLLMFARSAPKFITDLLGLPEVTGGDMMDMFKPAWQRVGGLSGLSAGINAYRSAKEYGEGRRRAFARSLTAGGHAIANRLRSVLTGKDFGESFATARDAAKTRTARNLEYANRYPDRRTRRHQIWQERWDRFSGMTTAGEKASANISAANSTIEMRGHAWDRANAKTVEHRDKYGGIVQTSYTDAAGARRTVSYDWATAEQRYSAIKAGGSEAFNGEFSWLESKLQDMRDSASREYIRQAFASPDGDAKTRNVFAEDIFKIIRSGADSSTVDEITSREVKIRKMVRDTSGNPVLGSDGKPQYIVNAAGEFEYESKPRKINLIDIAKRVSRGDSFTIDEAEVLSEILPRMDKVGGNIRVRQTATQTSVPKSS